MGRKIIKNRKNQNLVLLIEVQKPQKGLAFVAHGLGGFKEQPHVETFAKAFFDSGFSVIRWDAADTIGESGGKMEEASITNYYEDLEDVIAWAKNQNLYEEPFVLCGHSLGGIISALYAEKYPAKVKALAPISTLVSGKLSFEAHSAEELEQWKREGVKIEESNSKPGVIKRIKWSHMEDRLNYDLLKDVDKLTMPVLLMVGELDGVAPLKHQKILYEALPTKQKELRIIKGSEHTFKEPEHLKEVKEVFTNWINSLD